MDIIRKSSFTATPWKNGGGITHEVLRVPVEGVYRWRVSVAQVETSGPFSDFSGYRRTMVLLRGGGVRLAFAGGDDTSLRRVGDLVQFDGGLETHCDLLAGACADMNLMAANALRVDARVEPVTAARTVTSSDAISLVFVIEGALWIENAVRETYRLEPWDLAVIPAGEATRLGPAASDPGAPLAFFASLEDNLP